MTDLTHYVNGNHVAGTSGRFADVFNPPTGEVQARVPLASQEELDAAVAAAAAASAATASPALDALDGATRLTTDTSVMDSSHT